jgi:hypothetical protein
MPEPGPSAFIDTNSRFNRMNEENEDNQGFVAGDQTDSIAEDPSLHVKEFCQNQCRALCLSPHQVILFHQRSANWENRFQKAKLSRNHDLGLLSALWEDSKLRSVAIMDRRDL